MWERTGDERPAVADAGDGRRGGTGRLCASQSSNRRSPERRSSGEPPRAVAESLVNAERELWGVRRQLWLTSRTLLGYSAKLKDLRNPLRLEWSLSTFRILALGSFTHSRDNPA